MPGGVIELSILGLNPEGFGALYYTVSKVVLNFVLG